MRKGENFYRRDPMAALNGMTGLTLEERGVYNTVIDLLYSTWRPVEDNRQFIANWCGCAVQKLNPIIDRLIAKEKLRRVMDRGVWVLTNDKFDDERSAVKGLGKGRKGASQEPGEGAQVEEKSGEVGEKSAGVSENDQVLDTDSEQKQAVTALDREEKRREEDPPKPPQGGKPKADLFGEGDDPDKPSRRRAAKPIPDDFPSAELVAEGQAKARQAGANLDVAYQAERFRNWALGGDKRYADWAATWRNWVARAVKEAPKGAPAAVVAAPSVADMVPVWQRRIQAYRTNAYWNRLEWGGPPGKPDCKVPAEILIACGYAPPPRADVLPLEAEGKAA